MYEWGEFFEAAETLEFGYSMADATTKWLSGTIVPDSDIMQN